MKNQLLYPYNILNNISVGGFNYFSQSFLVTLIHILYIQYYHFDFKFSYSVI